MESTNRGGSAPSSVRPARRGWRRGGALIAALSLSLAVSACGAGSGQPGGGVDSLVIGTAQEPGSLNVLRDGDDGAEPVVWSINEPLVDRSADGLVPILAAKLPVHDTSDPTVWHVTLRHGVQFTNGEPFDAAAVKNNIDKLVDPKFGSTIHGIETLKGAKVAGTYSVDLITKQPDPWLLYRLSSIRFEPPKASQNADSYAQHPIGTGPYTFARWDKGQQIVLEKNNDYWGGDNAQLRKVTFRFVPDESARLAALQSGEVDMIGGVSPDSVGRIPQLLKSTTDTIASTLLINMEAPAPYDNVAFRQALVHAINRDSILKNLFGGQGHVEPGQTLPEGEPGFNDSIQAYPYDPHKAKDLLKQVQLPPNFAVTLVTTSGYYPKDREIGQAIAADWEAVGLKADVQYVSGDKWLDNLLAGGAKTSANSPAPMTYMPFDYFGMYASRIANRLFNRTDPVSELGSKYPEIDGLFKTAETSFDEAKALKAYQQIFKLAHDEVLNIPLIDYPDIWGATKRVTYKTGPGTIARLKLAEIHVS